MQNFKNLAVFFLAGLVLTSFALEGRGTFVAGVANLSGSDVQTTAVVGQWAQAQGLSGGEIITDVGVWKPIAQDPTSLETPKMNAPNFKIKIGANNSIVWQYSLSQSGLSSVEVFSADGRKVQTLLSERSGAGNHTWQGQLNKDQLQSGGAYIVRFSSGNQQQSFRLNVK